jgi:hypothetical protein
MGYINKRHRCPLPYIEGNGDIWRCDDCGELWRSYAPGNPEYNGWRRLTWLTRWLHS